MPKRKPNSKPVWSDVKAHLRNFDRPGLVALIEELYAASRDNQNFLHTRFGIGGNLLQPYKQAPRCWLWPEGIDDDVSVSKALKVLADYRKATRDPEGLVELMVFYCEQATGFSNEMGMEGDSWFNSLVRVFADALEGIEKLPDDRRNRYIARLGRVRNVCQDFGWGVGDDMNDLWATFGLFEAEEN